MKKIITTVLFATSLAASLSPITRAGTLEPTNPPAPSMFTLEQIYQKLLDNERKLLDNEQKIMENRTMLLGLGGVLPSTELMSFIPAGTFVMGDTFGDGGTEERPLHTNNISAFYMDKYEVTKALWDEVRAWALTNGYSFGAWFGGKAASHPVHSVDWYDAIAWCNARSEREGLTPCYTNANGTVYKTALSNSFDGGCKWSAGGYRLPTEAEWEKAARGGVAGQRFPWGNTITHSNANYYSSSSNAYDISSTRGFHPLYNDGISPFTSPVGYFEPNGYGLYDMSGNVLEWCWDWYGGNYYSSSPSIDPRGPSTGDLGSRVLRGGSWSKYGNFTRVAKRIDFGFPGVENNDIGFRCVRRP